MTDFAPISPRQYISGALAEQFERIGISSDAVESLKLQPKEARELINDTFGLLSYYAGENTPSYGTLRNIKRSEAYKFTIYAGTNSIAENIGWMRQQSAERTAEYTQISVTPQAIGRSIEPIATACRALDLADIHNPKDPNNIAIARIGQRAVMAMALAACVFSEYAETFSEPDYHCRVLEVTDIAETNEKEVGPLLVGELALKVGGTVGRELSISYIRDKFGDKMSGYPTTDVQMLRIMFDTMAISRWTKGDRSYRRKASYAIERAFRPQAIGQVVSGWFRPSET